jgi:hypothetical protein
MGAVALEDDQAMIDACHLLARRLQGEEVPVCLDDPVALARVLAQVTRIAKAALLAWGHARGLTEEEARSAALGWLAGQILQCEMALLDAGHIPGPSALLVSDQ